MDIFQNLTKAETDLLHLAPALVTILIGGADGKLDGDERNWSEKLLRARSYSGNPQLQDYYRDVAEGFWVDLQHEMSVLPAETSERIEVIAGRLAGLNEVFPKLEPGIAFALYKGLKGLAEEVAKASGGFLRMGAVAASEYQWVNLPMIHPVAQPEGLEKSADDFDANIWGEKTSD